MKISKVNVNNFRLLKKTTLDMKEGLSLFIGRNNSGKTSFLVLFEKFYKNEQFLYDDFSLLLREELHKINSDTNIYELSIQMILEIEYDGEDDLEHISEFILDLDPDNNIVKILFEVTIKKDKLISILDSLPTQDDKTRYIRKNLHSFLSTNIYIFENEDDLKEENRYKIIKKDLSSIKNLVNFQIIHAKRNVSSSDDSKGKKVLSVMTTKYFNKKNSETGKFSEINQKMIEMDTTLNGEYDTGFEEFLKNAKSFLGIKTLKVISNLEMNEVIQDSSKVVYGDNTNHLPEHLNGLGFMNILYLLLDIEMKKEIFEQEQRDINLLFIEEPEAHTHPQMQYKFIDEIKKVFGDIKNLQTIITTHSAQIVSRCDFKDIRYLQSVNDNNIKIKNFHSELKDKYGSDAEEFKFIEQYLSLQASELFFANKIIFIEGTTEKMLLPYYIKKFDEENNNTEDYIPISSQNISVLEVGANAKAFDKLIQFLEIQTLVITDIDTTNKTTKKDKNDKDTIIYPSCKVKEGTHTSNETIKSYFKAPDLNSPDFTSWFLQLKMGSMNTSYNKIKICYQIEEDGYHARSFEDAFIKINLDLIKLHRDSINGLQNKDDLDSIDDIYDLTERILKKKSDFAFSLLYFALSKNIDWKTPKYITAGLKWIQNDAS